MSPEAPNPGSIVSTTIADEAVARQIAVTLVEERLAACVQVLPEVTSYYRWQGRVEETREWLLQCKTSAARTPQLMSRLRTLHPYDTPEILAVTIAAGDQDYLAWVSDNTTGHLSPGGE